MFEKFLQSARPNLQKAFFKPALGREQERKNFMIKKHGFLPMNKKEMKERGWEQADFVYICGDAYVDHPSFGAAIITRLLEDAGYK